MIKNISVPCPPAHLALQVLVLSFQVFYITAVTAVLPAHEGDVLASLGGAQVLDQDDTHLLEYLSPGALVPLPRLGRQGRG